MSEHHSPHGLASAPHRHRGRRWGAAAGTTAALALLVGGIVGSLRAPRRPRRTADDRQFRALVDAVGDHALYMLDAEGRVSAWNVGAERLKGYRAEEILGEHFSRFFSEEDRRAGAPQKILEAAARHGKHECEGWRVRKDGSRFYATAVTTALRDAEGRLTGFAKITRDITERIEQQRALEQTRAALAQAQKMEALGQLTGGIAHDFNNFLQVIKTSVAIVQDRVKDSDPIALKYLEAARRNADRAAAVTQRLLTFARRHPLDPRPVNINQLLQEIRDLLKHAIGEGIQVETALSHDLWDTCADINQLETAILNIVINARDAMNRSGRLTLETANAALHEPADDPQGAAGEYVMLAVRDTGCGMSEEVLARIFEPFFTTKNPEEGTGLGLSQVFGFVRQSDGHVRVESRPGEGTTVRIYLPRLKASAASQADSAIAS